MESLSSTLKQAEAALMGSDKVADLAKDTKAPGPKDRLTSDAGVRQSNTDDWLKVVSDDHTGPELVEDSFSREKITRFDHERIPERVVHARGSAAFGTFRVLESAEDVTKAPVLTDKSRETPVLVRFSTVLGSRGSADTVRDVRGFATKFYTPEGNWDLVGNDIPVFFIQDALKFPDVIHAGKPEPHNEVPQAQSAHNNFWDFQFLHPEATHMFMWAMSDRGIPRSYRMMQGFGVNTYTLVDAHGTRRFVKFHWRPALGVHSLVWDEALKLAGQDPDFHRKDLWEAIEAGHFPRWQLGLQVLPEADEHRFDFDILDATKLWPEDLVPVRYIGELELNRNPDEFFTETEQAAFCTSHVVPGIGFSDDPLLQGRNFSYFDTQLTRLGPNWQELPVNRPLCPVMNFHRDGAMRHAVSQGTVNYWPNRHSVAPPADPATEHAYEEHAQRVEGVKKRARSAKFADHHSQAQLFWNSMSRIEQSHIVAALAFELDHCDDPLVYGRMVQRLAEIDPGLSQTVGDMVGSDGKQEKPKGTKEAPKNHGRRAPGLSQLEYLPAEPTIVSRRVAILVADGFDTVATSAVWAAVTAAGATALVVGPKRGMIKPEGGSKEAGLRADHHFEGLRSTMVDAVFVPGGSASAATLSASGRAVHWVREAFGHLKTVGATGEGVGVVERALALSPGSESSLQLSSSTDAVESYGVVTQRHVQPGSLREAVRIAKGAKGFIEAFFYSISQHRNWDRELDGLSTAVAY